MTSPDLPPLPPDEVWTMWKDSTRATFEGGDESSLQHFARAVQLAAYRAGMEQAAQIAADMPITYERDGHYFNTQPEDYEAAIRRAAEGKQ